MTLLSRRCSCGSPRRTLPRLARRVVRTVLTGLAWSGIGHTGCTTRQLAAVGQWHATLAVEAPCCARELAGLGEPRRSR